MSRSPEPRQILTPEEAEAQSRRARGNLYALEILFLGFIGIVTLVAFVEALGYRIVSSRTPFVIMVPLFILIAVHARRLWRVRHEFTPGKRISEALSGATPGFNKVVGFSAWIVLFVVLIAFLGHLVATFAFCVILMRFLAGERWGLTLMVAAGTTLFLFTVFEYLFNIQLYQGLILRYFLGFRDFG